MIRMMYKIAKAELQMLFFSPVAWLILVIFAIQAALNFTEMFDVFVRRQEMGYELRGITLNTFAGLDGVFTRMQSSLYFYIPLLTMSLVSKELSSGTIRLLYSSPITNCHIILGKFMSMMFFGGMMIGILLLFVTYGLFTVKDFDLPAALSGLLGLYLLLCAYAAIGIFMSSLTSYQVVAAIGTFGVLLILNVVGGLLQEYDIVRDITYWLAINGRSDEFISGLICSEDLLYFIIVSSLFLALTIIRLDAIRQKTRFTVTIGKYVGVVFFACFLGYFSSIPKLKWFYDATETKMRTLTPNSQDVVANLDGEVTITTYINLLDSDTWCAAPEFMKPDMKRYEQYLRFKPDMKLKYVYYYDRAYYPSLDRAFPDLNDRQRMVKLCKMNDLDSNRFKSPEEMRHIIDLAPEGNTFVTQIVRENGEKAWLRVYNDMSRYPGEVEISAAFKRMVMDLPKVGFLTGHGERGYWDNKDRGYSLFANDKKFRNALMNQGFDIEEVSLNKKIPTHINILVIAEMQKLLTTEEEICLQEYIDRGGDLFILAEPKRREEMNPLLVKFGFELVPGVLVKQDTSLQADVLLSYPTREVRDIAYAFTPLYERKYVVTTPGCAGLQQVSDKGYTVTTLFRSDSIKSWNELETVDFVDDTVRLNVAIGEVEKSYPTIVALSRKVGYKEQKIIISGDADCISNAEFSAKRHVRASNYTLISGIFYWLSDNEAPIDVRRPPFLDNKIYLGFVGMKMTKGLFVIFIPLFLLCAGIFIWIRRRGR